MALVIASMLSCDLGDTLVDRGHFKRCFIGADSSVVVKMLLTLSLRQCGWHWRRRTLSTLRACGLAARPDANRPILGSQPHMRLRIQVRCLLLQQVMSQLGQDMIRETAQAAKGPFCSQSQTGLRRSELDVDLPYLPW